MRNIKLEIEYDGTDYCGWQCQASHKSQVTPRLRSGQASRRSIQETIEKTLQKILQEKIKLTGSGRTDAGVHALAQVANFKTASNISLGKLQRALNALLPGDIAIIGINEVNSEFHSRFAAKSKLYRYTILNRAYRLALLKDKVYFYPYPLDINLMRKETMVLVGKHDLKSFCASGSSVKDTVRTIKRIVIKRLPYHLSSIIYHPKELPLIVIDIEADGFLYNMVRNIVGTLLEIGRGRFPKGSLRRILESKNRRIAGPTAPAHGLCLLEVKY